MVLSWGRVMFRDGNWSVWGLRCVESARVVAMMVSEVTPRLGRYIRIFIVMCDHQCRIGEVQMLY